MGPPTAVSAGWRIRDQWQYTRRLGMGLAGMRYTRSRISYRRGTGDHRNREYAIFDPRSKRCPPLAGYRRAPDGRWEPWPLDERGALHGAVLDRLPALCLVRPLPTPGVER